MEDLILAHAALVPMTDESHYLRDGALYISNNRIVEVARTHEILPKYSGHIIDLAGKLVIPPFLNAHHHLYQTGISRPSRDNLLAWLTNTLFKEEPSLEKEEVFESALLDNKTFLKSGVGYLILQESQFFYETIIEAVKTCKIKSLIGRYCGDNTSVLPDSLCESPEESLKRLVHYRKKYQDDTCVKVSLSPRFLPAVTPAFLEYIKDHMDEVGLFLQIHFNESKDEIKLTRHIHHKEPAMVLDSHGLLKNDTILPHSIYLSDEELTILMEKKPIVTTSPTTNLTLSGEVAPIAEYLQKGIPVGLGLDSFVTSGSQTYMHELHALPGVVQESPETLIPKILTSSAKIACKIFGGGVIRAGSSADLVIFNVRPRNPWNYIINHLNPEDVESTVLDGEVVYERESKQ